ncbi:class II fructose-bisphosphate aldolase [Oerskovia turbata]|uniref:Class II fructose-bisphosphate aldolase n=1 Tax=Oerskovia turbata TaxID=1713 RepID=A0A4V1N5L8_9CELL|nr:class II fructose-bisphosphate aldolase [Oerskovia turbata]RXR27308.1 class II fructose-bisphosphate aldolase [Oerskovia turbata]RXR36118.1 class II fructose-bisphosphate aldolase [Oerskovia turbata]
MPLVTAHQLVDRARAESRGVGAFNVIQVEHAEAFVAAAARAGTGVVLQISQNAARYHGGLEPIALATLAVARASSAPVVVHLDHAEDRALVSEAVRLGFTSVMYDGSALDYERNVEATADVVREAHARGVFVEAELGKVGGKDGVHAPGVRTDPAEAVAFVAATGVDALAVAVGSSHAMTDRTASLDFERIAGLRAAVPVPLVLHGSSGVADHDLSRAVKEGMTKINISTHLNNTLTQALRAYLDEHPTVVDPRKYLGAGRDAMRDEVVRLLAVLDAV